MSEAATRQFFNQTPPRAAQLVGVAGQPFVIPITNVPIAINLSKLFTQPPPALTSAVSTSTSANPNNGVGMLATSSNMGLQPAGVVGYYLTIAPEGTDIGIITGLQQADVSNNLASGGQNYAPDLSITGTLSAAGIYTAAPQTCMRVLDTLGSGMPPLRLRPLMTQDIWLGVVAVNPGILRIYQSTITGAGNF